MQARGRKVGDALMQSLPECAANKRRLRLRATNKVLRTHFANFSPYSKENDDEESVGSSRLGKLLRRRLIRQTPAVRYMANYCKCGCAISERQFINKFGRSNAMYAIKNRGRIKYKSYCKNDPQNIARRL